VARGQRLSTLILAILLLAVSSVSQKMPQSALIYSDGCSLYTTPGPGVQ